MLDIPAEKVQLGKVSMFCATCPNCDEVVFTGSLNFECLDCPTNFQGKTDSLRIEVNNYKRKILKILDLIVGALEKIKIAITKSICKMENSVDDVVKNLTKKMESSLNDALHNIEQLHEGIGSAFESTVMQMSDAQRQEMECSYQSLGNALALLSQKISHHFLNFFEHFCKKKNGK